MDSINNPETRVGNFPSVSQGSGLEEKLRTIQASSTKQSPSRRVHAVPLWPPARLHPSSTTNPNLHTPTICLSTIHIAPLRTSTLASLTMRRSIKTPCSIQPGNQGLRAVPVCPYWLPLASPTHTSVRVSQLP
jgi:hypothetical protein